MTTVDRLAARLAEQGFETVEQPQRIYTGWAMRAEGTTDFEIHPCDECAAS